LISASSQNGPPRRSDLYSDIEIEKIIVRYRVIRRSNPVSPFSLTKSKNTSMSNKHKLSEIRQIAITVSDVSTALPFYRDVLGLTFLFSPSPNLAFLEAGSVRIMLSTPQGAGTVGHNSIIYFKVTDIVPVHAEILGRGASNERDPQLAAKLPEHELWISFVRDPDGNLIGLMEEKR
jgi:predicted enzyme related to lactoylglutathione lyase